jgi:hypothetical protein
MSLKPQYHKKRIEKTNDPAPDYNDDSEIYKLNIS